VAWSAGTGLHSRVEILAPGGLACDLSEEWQRWLGWFCSRRRRRGLLHSSRSTAACRYGRRPFPKPASTRSTATRGWSAPFTIRAKPIRSGSAFLAGSRRADRIWRTSVPLFRPGSNFGSGNSLASGFSSSVSQPYIQATLPAAVTAVALDVMTYGNPDSVTLTFSDNTTQTVSTATLQQTFVGFTFTLPVSWVKVSIPNSPTGNRGSDRQLRHRRGRGRRHGHAGACYLPADRPWPGVSGLPEEASPHRLIR
jgi:hypothetical protein